jgi:muconate cycloisomerase
MVDAQQIVKYFEQATKEFKESGEYRSLVDGGVGMTAAHEFLRNIFRTHYLSAHIVAFCFASLPSTTAELLKENLLEEMGRSEDEPPHSQLLLEMVRAIGFDQDAVDQLIADARNRVALACASRVPAATLRELCLSTLLETMSFEFMLSRCSSELADALSAKYAIPRGALRWFALHSEVDIRHADEAITVIQDYSEFHQISVALFDQIASFTLGDKLFCRHYFPPSSRLKTRVKTAEALRVNGLTIYRLRIPFHQTFSHALHNRDESDAIIVKVRGSDGRSGFGEGLPRAYVTGETSESMIARIRDVFAPRVFQEKFYPGWQTMEQLQSLLPDWTRNSQLGDGVIAWNAAFCAVELALIDWSLRADHSALADYLPPSRLEVVYSGVISADSPKDAAALAKRMARLGINQIKVKVGTDEDAARLEVVRQAIGDNVELRADANGAWNVTAAIERLKSLERFNLAMIEQPVPAEDIAGMKQVRAQCGIPVMADESLVTLDQARRLIEQSACDLFNIRLSKNAGITGSLAIAKLAREAGIKIQVGAQVGETAILSAAGRALAAHLPELACAEGSFGTWLLTEDIAFENLAFGLGGRAPLLKSRGLSVTVKEETLERLTVEKIELSR